MWFNTELEGCAIATFLHVVVYLYDLDDNVINSA